MQSIKSPFAIAMDLGVSDKVDMWGIQKTQKNKKPEEDFKPCPRSFGDGFHAGSGRLREAIGAILEIKSMASKYRYVDNVCHKIMKVIDEYEKK